MNVIKGLTSERFMVIILNRVAWDQHLASELVRHGLEASSISRTINGLLHCHDPTNAQDQPVTVDDCRSQK